VTFIVRALPEVIVLGDGNPLIGPFCDWCGNRELDHRARDSACPIRRLHPLLPTGRREVCTCLPLAAPQRREDDPPRLHDKDCPIYKHGYTGSARRSL